MQSQYELKLESKEKDKVYTFHSADGLNSKDSFRDEEILLLDEVGVNNGDKVLVVQSNYGLSGVVFGGQAEEVVMQDTSARACKFSRINAEENSLNNFEVQNTASVDEVEGSFQKVMYVPAGYEPVNVVKNRLAESASKLSENGELYIAGRKKSGLKRYRSYLEENGEVEKIGKKGKAQAYRFTTEKETFSTRNLEKHFDTDLNGIEASFTTAEGLFSSGKLDKGTKILLETIDMENPSKVLDMACGYGAISIFLSKVYDCKLYLTDDDAVATKYAAKNLEKNNVENFTVNTDDCLDAYQDQKFDVIVSNPPTHQGKGVTSKMFAQAYDALQKGGELWLVYNQNMNYSTKLKDKFNSVQIKAEEGNFRVLKATK